MEKKGKTEDLWGNVEEEWKVESFTTPGVFYQVRRQVDKYTCDCPAFKKNPSRECKHIAKVLGKKPTNNDYEMKTKGGYPLDEVVSALQKSIRRGLVEDALWWAHELVDSGYVAYFWRRMAIIAAEDCLGWEPSVIVHACYENASLASKNFKGRIEGVCEAKAVIELCVCSKNRTADDAWVWVEKVKKKGLRKDVPDYALDQHTVRGRTMGRGDEFWYKESSKIHRRVGGNEFVERLMKMDNLG